MAVAAGPAVVALGAVVGVGGLVNGFLGADGAGGDGRGAGLGVDAVEEGYEDGFFHELVNFGYGWVEGVGGGWHGGEFEVEDRVADF